MEQAVLIIAGVLAVGSALGVVIMPNAVYSALMLLLNLLSLAVLFLLLYAQFMFVAQLLVYAGAIMVLFLFVVTLLNPGGENILRDKKKLQQAGGITLALTMGSIIISGLLFALTSNVQPNLRPELTALGSSYGTVEGFGRVLFTSFLLPFELTALVLLVALIGAVVLGKRQNSAPTGKDKVPTSLLRVEGQVEGGKPQLAAGAADAGSDGIKELVKPKQ